MTATIDPTTGPGTGTAQEYLPHRQILIVLGGLMAGMFLAALDQSIVGTALPSITSDLGGLGKLSWVVTAYLLTSTASTPLWGKISDLYGRRPLFQAAIVLFLLGSLAAGFAQDINQLIGFRALQGLGAGGLFALALATIGDIIPPRERGRYQGWFAAVFGTSSVLGPVLGGFLAEGPGWQWIFWVNIPIGLAALAVTTSALKLTHVRREHSIDYLGAAVIVASVTAILLYTAWAGDAYGWASGTALSLLVGGIVLAGVFVLVEQRAAEPIIPMELFANRVFSASNAFGFVVGMAMFGSLVFVPLYLQVVQSMSPTESGLALLPMVAGIFSTSITAGQIASRTGRYRIFPIAGSATMVVGVALLSRLEVETPYWQIAVALYILGAGLGGTMQIIVTAVQNSVDRKHMGAATSAVTFFRTMGGAFGTAAFGAVLGIRLTHHLGSLAGGNAAGTVESGGDLSALRALPDGVQGDVVGAYADALSDVFLAGVPVVMVAVVLALLIPEVRLRSRSDGVDSVAEPA
jgi:EmrB/QacA subfamily drug resistance transporter